MGENLYSPGQKTPTQTTRDGWTRTYKGHPPMNDDVKKMLYGYAQKSKIESILLFFLDICGYDEEYSSFLLREVIRGYI